MQIVDTVKIGKNTSFIKEPTKFSFAITFNIFSRINKERNSNTIWTIITTYGMFVIFKAMYETGNIIKRVPPIHHVVDVKLPVASITVTKESDNKTIIV